MSYALRSVALVTTSIVAGVLVAPGAVYAADTTTQLSAADMTAALKTVSGTSTTAAKNGWRASMSTTGGDQPLTADYVVDPRGGVASARIRVGTQLAANYAVAGKGLYLYVNDPTTRSAVTMMGRPAVRWAFVSKALKLDAHVKESAPLPASVLAEGVDHAGTKTSHDDGSTDYAFKAEQGMTVALHVNRAGVLTSARSTSTATKAALAYQYGAQHVKLPAASATVDWPVLNRAVAYLSMPTAVKSAAEKGATHTREAAKGKTVKVTSLRTIVRRDAAAFNKSSEVRVKVSNVDAGARVSATNPWTRKTASFTVTASGRKVLVAKG